MEKNDFGFEKIHFDILTEISNIGTGNAITALSKMLGKRIHMKVPSVRLVELSKVSDFIGGPEKTVAGIAIKLVSEISGIIMFIMDLEGLHAIIADVFGKEAVLNHNQLCFEEIELSAFSEIGSIMACSYLTSLSDLTNIQIRPALPVLCIDMAGAILSVPAIEFSKVSDTVLFMESIFETENSGASGYFILIPDHNSFELIFSSLGVYKYE